MILGVVVSIPSSGFIQEGKAEGALEALRGMMVPECLVVRGGDLLSITSRELVPGDIVVLEGETGSVRRCALHRHPQCPCR